jgi:hypothetical protein
MRNRALGEILALAVLLGSLGASAQVKHPDKAPRAVNSGQTPDLSGVWMRDAPPASNERIQYWIYEFNIEEPPMTLWGEAHYKAAKSSFGDHPYPIAETTDPVYHGCSPTGVPRVYLHPWPMQIAQARDEVVILFEYDSLRREIYTDGREHDTSLGPTWMGDSIGHWEGDALVTDTSNFNDKTWIDRIGHPHSDQLHVIERFRRPDHDHLVDDITIIDPKAYTKPWTTRLKLKLRPTWKLAEQFCEDGESFIGLENKEASPGK